MLPNYVNAIATGMKECGIGAVSTEAYESLMNPLGSFNRDIMNVEVEESPRVGAFNVCSGIAAVESAVVKPRQDLEVLTTSVQVPLRTV